MSAESITATRHVLSLMQPSQLIPHQKFLRLDLTDPLQYRYFIDRFGGFEGKPLGPGFPTRMELATHLARPHIANAPSKCPMLHELSTAPSPGIYTPVGIITAFNYDANTQVTADGILSIPGGFQLTDLVMDIYDISEQILTLIASTSTSSSSGFAAMLNATGTLVSPNDSAMAVLTGYYTDGYETTPFLVSQVIISQPVVVIQVTNPVHKVTTIGNPITVAIGRMPKSSDPHQPPQLDTDYYLDPNHALAHPELLLMVSGTATSSSPSDTFVTGQTVGGSLVLLKIGGAQPGGATVTFPNGVAAACKPDGAVLTWNFDFSAQGYADFGVAVPWTPGDTILMSLNLAATMNGPSGETLVNIAVTSDQNQSGQQIDNTAFIDSLQFYFGCLAAHSRVRMADGGEKAIREVGRGERVTGPNGVVWLVSMVKTGSEDKPMLEIETEWGDTILVTDGHPIITASGPRVARAVTVGEKIITLRGNATVVRVDYVSYDDAIFNLVLTNEDGSYPEAAAFYAEGILVGDDLMQATVERSAIDAGARTALGALTNSANEWGHYIETQQYIRVNPIRIDLGNDG